MGNRFVAAFNTLGTPSFVNNASNLYADQLYINDTLSQFSQKKDLIKHFEGMNARVNNVTVKLISATHHQDTAYIHWYMTYDFKMLGRSKTMASYGISQIKINDQQKLFSSKIIGIQRMASTVLYPYLEEYINGYCRSKSRILIFLGILIVSQANAAELKKCSSAPLMVTSKRWEMSVTLLKIAKKLAKPKHQMDFSYNRDIPEWAFKRAATHFLKKKC